MSLPNRRFSTGLTFLDNRLDGGIPVGSLLAMASPAGSQSDLLLYHLASAQPTLYVSTVNPSETELRAAVEASAVAPPVDLEFVHATPGEILEDTSAYLDRIRPESYVVIDPVDGLERAETDAYRSVLNELKTHLRETDSVGVVTAMGTEARSAARRLTLKRADYVWRLEEQVTSREISTRLLVTKARRSRALSEPIPLVVSDHVRVDTSRRIS